MSPPTKLEAWVSPALLLLLLLPLLLPWSPFPSQAQALNIAVVRSCTAWWPLPPLSLSPSILSALCLPGYQTCFLPVRPR